MGHFVLLTTIAIVGEAIHAGFEEDGHSGLSLGHENSVGKHPRRR